MKKCKKCLAHYSDDVNHECPPLLKMLVTAYKSKMKKFIAQKEMECSRCWKEIPTGAVIYLGEDVVCEDCYDEN